MRTKEFPLRTARQGYYNITATVRETIRESGVQSGICVVFCRIQQVQLPSTKTQIPMCSMIW